MPAVNAGRQKTSAGTVSPPFRPAPDLTEAPLSDFAVSLRSLENAAYPSYPSWERKGRKYYLKATADADGRMTYTYVVAKDGEIETWVSNSKTGTAANKRGGNLLQRQGE